MLDSRHRRSLLLRLAAGVAAASGVATSADGGGVAAEGGGRLRRAKPIALFKGTTRTIVDPGCTPVDGKRSKHSLIQSRQCEGPVRNCPGDDHRDLSASRLFRYPGRRNGDVCNGNQSFRLQEINRRLEGIEWIRSVISPRGHPMAMDADI